jgi:hypothetical protein
MQAGHFRSEAMDFLTHLHRQFACRAEDQNLWVHFLHIEFRKRGKRECRGFSRAGSGKAEDVLAEKGRGNAHRLNRRWALVAESFNGGEQGIGQPEFGKRRRIHVQF